MNHNPSEPRQFTLLRKLLKAIGLSDARVDDLITTIQAWLTDDKAGANEPAFPYQLRDDFLSPAELTFYGALHTAVSDWATICPKVSLGDLFHASTGDFGRNQAYRNKIDRKHVDFLLCAPPAMRPLLGIELDDGSHRRADRQARDAFVDGVFAAAGLPLAHVRVQRTYDAARLRAFLREKVEQGGGNGGENGRVAQSIPGCPRCGKPMVRRTAQRGPNAGSQFWGCADYPHCKGILTE